MTQAHGFALTFVFLFLPHPFLSLRGSKKLTAGFVAGKHGVPRVSLCFWGRVSRFLQQVWRPAGCCRRPRGRAGR